VENASLGSWSRSEVLLVGGCLFKPPGRETVTTMHDSEMLRAKDSGRLDLSF